LVFSTSHDNDFGAWCRLGTKPAEPRDQPTGTSLRAEPVGENPAGNAIEPTKCPIIGRNIVDSSPGDQEYLGRALPCGLFVSSSSAIRVDLPVIGIEEMPKMLLLCGRSRHLLPKDGSLNQVSGSQNSARPFRITRDRVRLGSSLRGRPSSVEQFESRSRRNFNVTSQHAHCTTHIINQAFRTTRHSGGCGPYRGAIPCAFDCRQSDSCNISAVPGLLFCDSRGECPRREE